MGFSSPFAVIAKSSSPKDLNFLKEDWSYFYFSLSFSTYFSFIFCLMLKLSSSSFTEIVNYISAYLSGVEVTLKVFSTYYPISGRLITTIPITLLPFPAEIKFSVKEH